jgi:hypothetical protein
MTTATATDGAPVTPPKLKGFGPLDCPCCGAEACIDLDLARPLSGDEACHCSACSERFSLARVRQFIARWQRVLAWVDLAPDID